MDSSYGDHLYPYFDSSISSFGDETVYDHTFDDGQIGPYGMERRVSNRSDEVFYEEDAAEVANESPYPDQPGYQDYLSIGAGVPYPAYGSHMVDFNTLIASEAYYRPEIKQEPGLYLSSNTLDIAQILHSTPEQLMAAAEYIAENAASLIANGPLNPMYITSAAIEERSQSAGGERQAIQSILEHYLLWYLDNPDDGGEPTARLLDEAACQLQLRLKGPVDETNAICSYAILCSLQKLRSDPEESTPEKSLGSAKSSEKTLHICQVPGCDNKVFGRSADLDRHTRMLHSKNKKEYFCDYKKCSRSSAHGDSPFFRPDHFRDHLREQHKEDLLRRSVKPDNSWWASRSHRALTRGWWRCSKCLVYRVSIADHGYTCPGCGNSCETERQNYRESLS